jgi:hypothetical protein
LTNVLALSPAPAPSFTRLSLSLTLTSIIPSLYRLVDHTFSFIHGLISPSPFVVKPIVILPLHGIHRLDFDSLSQVSISERLAEPKYSDLLQGQEQLTAKAQVWAQASPQEIGPEAAGRLEVCKWWRYTNGTGGVSGG